jgi:hypothetical protein
MVVLGIIGLLSIIIGALSLIWLIVSSFTKYSKKPPLILLAVCVGIFIIDLISTSAIQENQAKAAAQSSSKLAASKSSEKKFSESLNKMGNEAAKEDSRKLKENSSTSVSTNSSSTETPAQKYQKKLNSLNGGTAEWATYDQGSNTVTWIGYDAWSSYSHSDLQKAMDLLQTMTYRQSVNYNIQNPNIVVKTESGHIIATASNGSDLSFSK